MLFRSEAERLLKGDGLLESTYRRIDRKDLLHLAILLHDLGKGLPEDHSEVGRRIAEAAGDRFGLSPEDRSVLVFLVHRHLYMSHLAYRRDTSDKRVQLELSQAVGSGPILRMLYALTAVDTMAVGPGTYNQWKADLLQHLFDETMSLFGDEAGEGQAEVKAVSIRQKLLAEHEIGRAHV